MLTYFCCPQEDAREFLTIWTIKLKLKVEEIKMWSNFPLRFVSRINSRMHFNQQSVISTYLMSLHLFLLVSCRPDRPLCRMTRGTSTVAARWLSVTRVSDCSEHKAEHTQQDFDVCRYTEDSVIWSRKMSADEKEQTRDRQTPLRLSVFGRSVT